LRRKKLLEVVLLDVSQELKKKKGILSLVVPQYLYQEVILDVFGGHFIDMNISKRKRKRKIIMHICKS
jgi:hypothetical protein